MVSNILFLDSLTGEEFIVPESYEKIAKNLWKSKKSTIVEMPFYTDFEYLIPIFYAFNALDAITAKSVRKITDYEIGDTLIFNKYVFRYLGVHETDKNMVKLRFAGDCDLLVSIDKCPLFMKSDLGRLSTDGGFFNLLSEVKREGITRLIQNQYSYDKSIIYFTTKSKVRDILANLEIEGKPIVESFLISELVKGKTKSIGNGKKTGIPLILLCSDIESLFIYSEANPETIDSIFFEDEKYKLTNRNFTAFELLLEKQIPLYMLSDWNTLDSDNVIKNLNFNTIAYKSDKDNLTENSPRTFRKKCNSFHNAALNVTTIDNKHIENIRKKIQATNKNISNEMNEIQDFYYKLVRFSYRLMDYIIPLDSGYFNKFKEDFDEIIYEYEEMERYIESDLNSCLTDIINNIRDFISEKSETKNSAIMRIIRKSSPSMNIALVYDRKQDANDLLAYFRPSSFRNIVLLTSDEYAIDKRFWDKVIVTAYYRNTYQNVINKWNFEEAELILYKFQKPFYEYSHRQLMRRKDTEYTSDTVMLEDSKVEAEIDFDVDITNVALERKYIGFQENTGSNISYTDAIPFTLSGDYVIFFTKNKKVFDTTDLILGRGDSVITKEAHSVKVGDFIALRESDRDIIKASVDYELQRNNMYELRDIASLWSEPLYNYCEKYGLDQLHEELKLNGSKVTKTTLRNWVYDEDMIGPRNIDDLEVINKFTGGKLDVTKIHDAISRLRVMHQSQGRYLSKQLSGKLKELLRESTFNSRVDRVNIEEIGDVRILRINGVGSIMPIAYSNLNRLHGGV